MILLYCLTKPIVNSFLAVAKSTASERPCAVLQLTVISLVDDTYQQHKSYKADN